MSRAGVVKCEQHSFGVGTKCTLFLAVTLDVRRRSQMMMKQKQRYMKILLWIVLAGILGFGALFKTADAATDYKYLIKVNKQQNCVTIYEKDTKGKYTVPVKAMVCSTGWATPLGTYNTQVKYRWKILLEDVWGQYSTRITGSILFHSVWYYQQNPATLSAYQYNKLGTTCSHGCIRLTVEDAKWIYDNCPVGTTVVIYNDKKAGPLGKPAAQKLKAGTGWDPTDPAENNPFLSSGPLIQGAVNKTIEWNSSFDAMAGITAHSGKGGDLTSSVTVSGKVDTKKPGVYKLTYRVEDSVGKTAVSTVKIKVKECPYEVKLTGVRDRVINKQVEVDRDYCLKGVTASFGKKKLSKDKIDVKIRKNDEDYQVTYNVTGANGKTIKQTVNYYVDSQAPVIEAEHTLYDANVPVDKEFALEFIKAADDYTDITSDYIDVSIKEVYERGHLITYTVHDEAGNVSTATIQITQCDLVVIQGVKNQMVQEGTVVDQEYVMRGVSGFDVDKDITDQIQVTISDPVDHVYTVTYELKTEDDEMKIVAFFISE